MTKYRLTSRLKNILTNAEVERKMTKSRILQVSHILLSLLKENSGVFVELKLDCKIDVEMFNDTTTKSCSENHLYRHYIVDSYVSREVLEIFKVAEAKMSKYNQIYLNEGHLIDGLLSTKNFVSSFLSNEEKKRIIDIASSSRDMAVSLEAYCYPELTHSSITFRRATQNDEIELCNFISSEFNKGWADNVSNGFRRKIPPIFVAFDGNKIVGFSAYDVVKNKKGLFGPMGISISHRDMKIGYNLLHLSLNDMNKSEYAYAIISEAGPLEFYEKACGATLILK